MNIIDSLTNYYKIRRRARKIKNLRKKIDPYLQKDFSVELNYKLWVTKGSRFKASERNLLCGNLSSQTIVYLSAYLIILNLVSIFGIPFFPLLSSSELGFASISLSILILIYSQLETAKNHLVRADKYHQCGLEIGELYNELRMIKTFQNDSNPQIQIRQLSQKYDEILRKYENHLPIDFEAFKLTKPKYFELSLIERFKIMIKNYLTIEFKYHLMIYGPIIFYALCLNFT